MTAVTGRYVGQSLGRKEDRRLLTGRGRFVADLRLPGQAVLAFARSNLAHARVRSIGTAAARTTPGVVAVLTAADIRGELAPIPGMQNRPPAAWRNAVEHAIDIPDQPLLADDVIRYVGEPYAIVVAESESAAADAIERLALDAEPLPVVSDIDGALCPGAAAVHTRVAANVVARFRLRKGDAQAVPALRRIRRQFVNHRYLAMPIECRAVVAEYDDRHDAITIWSTTQVVHWVRREVAKQLRLPEARVRCIAPDVGGGFGVKGHVYPEEILVAYVARRLGRPVAWIEERREHMLSATHARDDEHDAEIVFDDSGRLHALIDTYRKDSGAFTPVGIGAPSNTATHISGPYVLPNLDLSASVITTNKSPNAPYRGSGRPEGTFVIERLLDLIARELNLDPVEVRLRNMIRPEQMPYAVGLPYRDGAMVTYDSGDYPAALSRAIEAFGGLAAIRSRQAAAWREGRYLGLGLCCYVEGTGAGPFEGATVRVDPSGSLLVATGACSQGQGHETVFAQVTADEWGVRPEDVTVVLADTAAIAYGYGTIASRSAVNSSAAIRKASAVLRQKVLAIGGALLECDARDLELRAGKVVLKGTPEHGVSLQEIARAAMPGWDNRRPAGMPGGLEVTEYFEPPTVTWAYGVHAAIAEVDPETGDVAIERYVVAHDAGVLLNPMLANAQIMGGIAQGLGGCLLERVVFDREGQNLTASLLDYALPIAVDLPPVEILHSEIPSPLNELGVKGLGEGGAVAPPAVIVNAVCDALRPIGFEWNRSFLDREAIVRAFAAYRA